MKVLQINCVYPTGSTGKIVNDIHNELIKNGHESIICYGRGKRVDNKNVYKICSEFYSKCNNMLSRISGIMYGGCFLSTKKLIKIIKKEKPNVVHLHCINGYFVNIYKIITWLKNNNIKTILTLHAEFIFTANCGYALDCNKWITGCGKCPRLKKETKSLLFDNTHLSWKKMYKAFENFKNIEIVSVSPWIIERAKKSPILEGCHHSVVLNGINTNIFRKYDTIDLRKKMNLVGKKVIFHVTSYFSADKNHIKGGYYVLKLAERLKNENVQILVAGNYDRKISAPQNITFLGKIINQKELAEYYSLADVALLTSKKESFSMPVAESLCCGTPIVGFKAGAPEQITIKKYSEFVEYANEEALLAGIKKYINRKKEDNIQIESQKKYSTNRMVADYIKIYERIK